MSNRAAQIREENPGLSISRRGRRFIEFELGDGRKKMVTTLEPMHCGAERTQEIDTTWVADSGAWQWRMSSGDYQARARSTFNAGSLTEWRIGEQWVIFDPQSINFVDQNNSRQQIAIKQAVSAVAEDDGLSFPDGYGPGRHFSYRAQPERLVKHITFDTRESLGQPTSLTGTIWFEAEFTIGLSSGVDVYLDGVKWAKTNNVRVKTANKIEFKDSATGQQVLWLVDKPYAVDANGVRSPGEYELRRQGSTTSLFITVRIPYLWMNTATYPVTVDPTLTLQPDAAAGIDTYTYSGDPDGFYGDSQDLQFRDASRYALIKFDLSDMPAGATVTDATLSVYNAFTSGSNRGPFDFHPILVANSGWTEAANWNYADGDTTRWAGDSGGDGGADAGCSVSGTDWGATEIGSVNYISSSPLDTEMSTALTVSAVQDWVDGSNYGVAVTNATGDTRIFRSSDYTTAAARPKLVIVYTEGGVTIAPSAAALTLSAPAITVSAPAGGVTIPLDAATLTLAAGSLSLTLGGVSIPLDAATLTLTPGSLSLAPGEVSILLDPGSLSLAPGSLSTAPGAVSVHLSPGAIISAPGSLSLALGGVSIPLSAASLTLGAPSLTTLVGMIVNLSTALLGLDAGSAAVVPGAAAVQLGAAALAINGANITVYAPAPGAVVILMGSASASLAAGPLDVVPGQVAVSLDAANLALLAMAAGVVPGEAIIDLDVSTLAATAEALGVAPGGVVIPLDSGTIIINGEGLEVIPGPVSVTVQAAVLTLSGAVVIIRVSGEGQPMQLRAMLVPHSRAWSPGRAGRL